MIESFFILVSFVVMVMPDSREALYFSTLNSDKKRFNVVIDTVLELRGDILVGGFLK